MLKKMKTMVNKPPYDQEELAIELSAQEQITSLNKLRQEASKREPRILAFTNANEIDIEEKIFKSLKLKLSSMSLSERLEYCSASLRNDSSIENELLLSLLLTEYMSNRIEQIVSHINTSLTVPPYVQEYICKESKFVSRLTSILEPKKDPEIIDSTAIQDNFYNELQREVIRMIEAKTTPTGERYIDRKKPGLKSENAKEFLLRVYVKFTRPVINPTDSPFPLQGIYQDQLKKIDPELLVAINQFVRIREQKTSQFILPKSERVDKEISSVVIKNNTLFSIHSRFYRNKNKKKVG